MEIYLVPITCRIRSKPARLVCVYSRPIKVKEADIVVCAVGRAEMVKGDWIKPGAAVIDVGINSVDDPTSKKGWVSYFYHLAIVQ